MCYSSLIFARQTEARQDASVLDGHDDDSVFAVDEDVDEQQSASYVLDGPRAQG